MIDRYDWSGGSEALWRFGPATGPVVAFVLPPFEEANRTRALVAAVLRTLAAAHGVAGILPDLPGQGDSVVPTDGATLADWRAAFAAACASVERPVVAASIRAGALVDRDAAVAGRWQLAPQTGGRLLRELDRIGRSSDPADPGAAVTIAGNRIAPTLLAELAGAVPVADHPVRIVRLGSDAAAADLRIDAAPPWRRAEPDRDLPLAHALAADLAAWSRACAGC